MRDKLPVILLALGFAVAGSGGTALGFMLAQRGPPARASQGDLAAAADTALPQAGRRSSTRPARAKAVAAGRSKGQARGRAAALHAGGRGAAAGRGQSRSWANLAEGLDINAEQQQAWQQMMDDIRGSCVAKRLEQGDTTLELMVAAVSQEEASAEDLHAQVDASVEARREASHCVLNEALEFRAALTSEQRAALAGRVVQLRERRQAWMDAWSD